MIALGIGNILGSFFGSMPITASFGRSSVQSASGVKTPLANIYGGIKSFNGRKKGKNKDDLTVKILIYRHFGAVGLRISNALSSLYSKSNPFRCHHYVRHFHGRV